MAYAVEVKHDCPHAANAATFPITELHKITNFDFECAQCEDKSENWLCLSCGHVACSSYVNSHMVDHKEETNHQVVLGFNDLSVWCYECEHYIAHDSIRPYLKYIYKLKFEVDEIPKVKDEELQQIGFNEVKNEEISQILPTKSIQGLAEYIKAEKCSKVIILTGAGLSVAAGIPDFRSPNTGLYSQLGKYNLPSPEAIFSIGYFEANPKPFYTFTKSFFKSIENVKPTLAHFLITLFEKKQLLLRNYTQNIDLLEVKAGVSEEKVIYPHGSLKAAKCIKCEKEYTMEYVREEAENDRVPVCACGGFVKPDVVFFGEKLTERFAQNCQGDFRSCDLLIIMGTSLKVNPVRYLPNIVSSNCPRVVVNLQEISAGFDFEGEDNRDYFYRGTTDQFALDLADALGWADDLSSLADLSLSSL